MPCRWDVTKAVRASSLPAPSRLIMLVLADVAEVGSAEIPEQFTPSLGVLERETGLSRRTVQTHLAALETAGWIVRVRPSTAEAMWRGERVRYGLAIPSPVVQEVHQGGAGDAPPLVQEMHHPSAGVTPGVVQELHGGGAGAAPLYTDLSDQDQIKEPSSSEKPTTRRKPEPERSDVEQICTHLADQIEANGSKRPTITAKWRTEARLLIDKDGRTVEQIIRAIDWCQNDPFWHSNILSIPKLREKYDVLRLQATRVRGSPNGKPSTTDARVTANLAVVAAFEAKEITA